MFAPEVRVRDVFVRVGEHAGKIYLDLCDDEWRAVEIDSDGWRIVTDAPVRFRRAPGMLPLPEPLRGGSVGKLREFVNIGSDDDFILLVAYILAALRGRGPYPMFKPWGEPGSAKSTLMDFSRALVDPHKVSRRRLPRDDRDLFIAANNGHAHSRSTMSRGYRNGCQTHSVISQLAEDTRPEPFTPMQTGNCSILRSRSCSMASRTSLPNTTLPSAPSCWNCR